MLTVSTRALADTDTLVDLAGEIDLANAAEVGGRLLAELDRAHGRMVIRMADVRFLDSAGMEMLRVLRERAVAQGGAIVLAEPSRQVRRLLRLDLFADKLPVLTHGLPCTG